MAIVKSKSTVSRKVMSSTATSLFGLASSSRNVRQPLMLYDTTTSTPARQAIGMYCASGMKTRKISSRTAAWTMPATGVRPPLLIFVIVLAIAPVAGIPPKSGEQRFAMPCPMSSWFESWRRPVTPSATVAESNDSMAPSTAMVRAGCTSCFTPSHVNTGTAADGSSARMLKRSPIVSMLSTPA